MIIPGILTDSLEEVQKLVSSASNFASRVSIDIIDGVFADNLTVLPDDLREIDFHQLSVDVQLMTEEPVAHLGALQVAKVNRVFGHIERMHRIEEFIEVAQELGFIAGIAFDLHTPLVAVATKDLLSLEAVLLMAVKAGHSGQTFDQTILRKIGQLRTLGFQGHIVVDGGMHAETISLCRQAGADQFSVTSALWQSQSPSFTYQHLSDILKT